MAESKENLYKFGKFELDTEEKMLRQDRKTVSLPPKVLDILCLLVERQGKVVTKNEIMDTVWADSFVEESNLKQSIYTLRKVLGDDENNNPIIETVPRRGYRIVIPIRQIDLSEAPPMLPETAELTTPISYKKSLITFGMVAALLLLIGFLVNLSRRTPAPIENVSFQKLTFSGDVSFPIISPDGKSFAFVREKGIYLQDINTGNSIRIDVKNQKVFGNLQFSVDGENLTFRNETRTNSGGDIFEVSRFGGFPKKLAENSWSGIGFSPDKKKISFVRFLPQDAKWLLFVKNLETGEEKAVFEKTTPDSIYRSNYCAWSPDGKKILAVGQEKPGSSIYVIDAETGQAEKQDTPRFVQIEQTVWSPNGKSIYLVGRERNRFFQLWRLTYPNGELSRLTNDLNIYRNISISNDGKSLLAQQQVIYSHLWVASADNLENQKQLTFGNLNRDGNTGLAWTPKMERLIYASRITGNVDLWSVRLSDNVVQQLTKDVGTNNENPTLATDGKYIFFESNRNSIRHIWRIDSNGENPTQISFSENEMQFCPLVSADGKHLYYLQRNNRGNFVVKKTLADDKTEILTEQGKIIPDDHLSLSPDGKWLAFSLLDKKKSEDDEPTFSQINILSTDNSSEPKSYKISTSRETIRWTADGKAFDYLENTPAEAKIWRMDFIKQSEPKLILTVPNTFIYNFVWSPDGKKLALARGKNDSDVMLLKNFE